MTVDGDPRWEHRHLDQVVRFDAHRVEGSPIEPPLSIAILAEGKNVLVLHVEAPAGGRTPPHEHDHESVVQVIEGNVTCELPDGAHELTPGSTLLIADNCMHSLGTEHGATWLEIKSPPQATWH